FHGHRRRMADAMSVAVRTAGVAHVVFLSAAAASLSADNGPARDLHHAENALRASGARVTAIRACYFQDNVLAVACPARQEGVYPSFLPSPDVAFPTVATRDIGRIAARALVEPPAASEIVDLVGPAYSVRDMAGILGQAIGRDLRIVTIPPAEQVAVLIQQASLPRAFAEALAEMFACFASGRVSPQGDRTERGTTTLEEVLRDGLESQ
ncbi:MAG TPA: NmrA family NAD(P)-binding protein, partial [Kofleriaceae bacterium]|nr:NmrA family NAD(P)-binding protein [Kofleriaceae bacterium]